MEGIVLLISWKNMVGRVCAQRSCTYAEILGLLCSCDESPVLLLGEVTPHGVMEYAMGHLTEICPSQRGECFEAPC